MTDQNDVIANHSTVDNAKSARGLTAFGHVRLGCMRGGAWKLVPCTVCIKFLRKVANT